MRPLTKHDCLNGKPVRGDVMVFKFPPKPSMNFIKRVVGLPGDKIHYENDNLYINDVLVERKLVRQEPQYWHYRPPMVL